MGGNGGSGGAGGAGTGGTAGGSGNAAGAGNTGGSTSAGGTGNVGGSSSGGSSGAGGSANVGGSGNAGGAVGNGAVGGTTAPVTIGQGSAFPNGIGTDWNWTTGVAVHDAGPYAPCGIIGTGLVTFGAANPKAAEVAFASRAGVVFFYSSATGAPTRAPFYASGPLAGVAYSRDGSKLVVAGDTGVQIVRLADSTVLYDVQPFDFVARAAALSPDGTLIAALGWDSAQLSLSPPQILRLIRVSDGKSIAEKSFVSAADSVPPEFSPDGSFLVADGAVLSVPSFAVRLEVPFYPPQTVLSPDGTKIAGGGSVVDIATGNTLKSDTPGSSHWSAFSPDGTLYAESDADSNVAIHLYSTSNWTEVGTASIPYPVSTDDYGDGRFFFSSDGTTIIAMLTGSPYPWGYNRLVSQIVSVPDLVRKAVIEQPQVFNALPAFAPDGSLFAVELANSTTGVWRTSDLALLSDLPEVSNDYAFLGNGAFELVPLGSAYNPLTGAALGLGLGYGISPDGRLGVFQWTPNSWIFRLADLSIQATVPTPKFTTTTDHRWTFSPDNRFVAGVGTDAQTGPFVTVFDATTGATLATLPGAPPIALTTNSSGAARLAAFVPSSTTPSNNTTVGVWSIPDGKSLFQIQNANTMGWTAQMAFSPDGSLIAEGVNDIRIYEVETGTLRQTLPAQTDPQAKDLQFDPRSGVISLAFSATGQLATTGFDGTVRFWCSP